VHNIENSSIATTLMEADLGSILDLTLLYPFAPHRSPTRGLARIVHEAVAAPVVGAAELSA
jgi:hypothetical protein